MMHMIRLPITSICIIVIGILLLNQQCSHDPSKKLRSLIDSGDFDQANLLLSNEFPKSPYNPDLLFFKLELLIKENPDNYLRDKVIAAETSLKNHGVSILGTIRQTMLFDKNMVFKFHLARVVNSLEPLSGKFRNAFETIMIHSLESPHPSIRIRAIEEVGRFIRKDETGLILLLNSSLKDSVSAKVRLTAARVMARRWQVENGYKKAIEVLEDKNSSRELTMMAVAAIGYMKTKKAAKIAHKSLNNIQITSIPVTRRNSGYNNPLNVLWDSDIYVMNDDYIGPSLHNIKLYGNTIDTSVFGLIAKRYPVYNVLELALDVLEIEAKDKWLESLYNRSSDIDLKTLVIEHLGTMGNSESVPFLISQLAGPTPKIQYTAIMALGNIGHTSVQPVIDSLGTDNPLIKRNATVFLKLAGSKAASQAIFRIFLTDDTDNALFAAEALAGIRDSSLVDTLISQIENPDNMRSLQAIRILGETGDKRAISALTQIKEPREKLFQAQAAIKKIRKANAE